MSTTYFNFFNFFADEALNERMSPAHHPQQHGCLPYAERVSGSASAEYDALKPNVYRREGSHQRNKSTAFCAAPKANTETERSSAQMYCRILLPSHTQKAQVGP